MCRSIKVLRTPAEIAERPGIEAASLQFVRKVSGMHKPSKANQAAFDAAVAEIANVTQRLLQTLPKPKAPLAVVAQALPPAKGEHHSPNTTTPSDSLSAESASSV